jgi:uncharacterized membrane protein
MMFVTAIVALTLIAFAVLAYRESALTLEAFEADMRAGDPVDGALAVARQRLDRGEITAEEYERIISILRD